MNNIHRKIIENEVCVLTLDRPGSSANIFDRATLEELEFNLGQLGEAKGLIINSAKDGIYVAGADLHGIKTMDAGELQSFIELGQRVFNKLAGLKIPTVAAVHGAAVGGGYEICLACDYRLASPDRVTKLGLPETQLGILPAWGGCTRLPKLIGVAAALDVILGGRVVAAKQALKLGMVDELVSREYQLNVAAKWLARGKHHNTFSHSAPVNAVVDMVIAPKVRSDVQKRTHGHYPAVEKALEVVMAGAGSRDEVESLARERAAILELVKLESTRNLLELFFLQERAKKLTVPGGEGGGNRPKEAGRAAVIGAGVMGAGIAQWLSARGMRVILRDIDANRVAAGMATAAKLYADGVKHRAFTPVEARSGMERISPAPQEVSLLQSDFVIEAAVEKMEIKKAIFRRLDELSGAETILATNTSALSITELAGATRDPGRVVGIHFFNPVHKMQLVEVIRGRDTNQEVIRRTLRFVQKIGKLPVLVKDSPGFLVNRILLPYMLEAGFLFESGLAVEEIDAAMVDFGMPMGPLRLIDEVGVDISEDVAATLSAAFPQRMRVPGVLGNMIGAGLLGRKVGKGFYLHSKTKGDPEVNPAVWSYQKEPTRSTREQLQQRMVLLMVNEAARCLEEGLVETPGDVDFAMVMGTGFAPFRGGPLRYADSIGTDEVTHQLEVLAESAGSHYLPCDLLKNKNGKPIYESND